MKRFDFITESDARVLPPGEPVMLARGGQVTPLAHDTLKERRIAVVHEGRPSDDDAALVPAADVRSIAVASDHTGRPDEPPLRFRRRLDARSPGWI